MADERNQANTHITNLTGRFRVTTTPPTNPVTGDMYYDLNQNVLCYYDGTQWRVSGVFS